MYITIVSVFFCERTLIYVSFPLEQNNIDLISFKILQEKILSLIYSDSNDNWHLTLRWEIKADSGLLEITICKHSFIN